MELLSSQQIKKNDTINEKGKHFELQIPLRILPPLSIKAFFVVSQVVWPFMFRDKRCYLIKHVLTCMNVTFPSVWKKICYRSRIVNTLDCSIKKCSPAAPPLNNFTWAQSVICPCSICNIHRCGSWFSVMWIVLNRGAQLPSALQWRHMVSSLALIFFFFPGFCVGSANLFTCCTSSFWSRLSPPLPVFAFRGAELQCCLSGKRRRAEKHLVGSSQPVVQSTALADAFSHRLLSYR